MLAPSTALDLVGTALLAAAGDCPWPAVLHQVQQAFAAGSAAVVGPGEGLVAGPRHLCAGIGPNEWLSVRRSPDGLPFDGVEVEVFTAVAPHIGRALRLRRRIEERDAPAPTLAEAFRLTPSEARIARSIARGQGLFETATELGISRNTARTHMKRIYAKTGARRQGDLVRLLKDMAVCLD
ncbi:MAG: helix-turn-helix transcriptional regulator [Alphaproteobacteria bacterium]